MYKRGVRVTDVLVCSHISFIVSGPREARDNPRDERSYSLPAHRV